MCVGDRAESGAERAESRAGRLGPLLWMWRQKGESDR